MDERIHQGSLLTPQQASVLVNLSVKTLAQWRWQGTGPPFTKLGGRVYYPLAELQQWIKAQGTFTCTAQAKMKKSQSYKNKGLI